MTKEQRLLALAAELTSVKWLSRLIGRFTRSRWSRALIPRYARAYAIRVEEAEKLPDAYRSLNDFFVRRLKPGLRPVDRDARSLVSPVDGTVTGIGPIGDRADLIVKGQYYRADDLLGGSPLAASYAGGFFVVLYLSPADYHRVHSPVAGTVTGSAHFPGRTYPVNAFGLERMRRVLSRNERLITYIRHAYGVLPVIKVGAMNVSSIRYAEPMPEHPAKGDELARFEFGSTVVLLVEPGSFAFRPDLAVGSRVRVGEPLGRWGESEAPLGDSYAPLRSP
ncbi:archaetidylserine decarboxylase [Paenibacillus flagellatus]|uniref:Phosphatidylserine decarboxylase proenzyme n=1 Tax=Paenibacillus flagellatus TaxID=2211139 RepID=A0A2V5K865_9BACL|nr:archaetidylserine decarboxylase [Paenibacillus flagellatus]PYI54053.1 phosphatidylserine decarboxylase [Paenibacillus flagellatus]